MAKRLRGWQLEREVGKGERIPLDKGKQSRLATALLSLWSHGKLSAITVRYLANCACLDGCHHDELADIAKAGSFGKHPGNCHRDLQSRFVKQVVVPNPTDVPVRCIDPKSLKKDEEIASAFLPHIMFSSLAAMPNFYDLFPIQHLERFWDGAEAASDERLIHHPMKTRGWKKCTIPLFIHGDAAEMSTTDSLMIWSWGALMTLFSSLQSKFLIASFPKSSSTRETWDDIMKQVCWSLNALLQGIHPTHDADGIPLKKGSPFFEKRSQQLCAGYKGVVWCIMGDAEFFANSLHLPHWSSINPCGECDCLLKTPAIGKWVKTIEIDKQEFTFVSNQEAIEAPCSNHLLFHRVPGLSTTFVRGGDALHILFCKGLYSHLLGSVLHFLVFHEGPGRQNKQPWERLAVVWEAMQKAYRSLQSPTRLSNLKLSMFCNPKQPHSEHPQLNIKGAEAKHFLPAFLLVCRSMLRRDIWLELAMLEAMEHMQQLVQLYDEKDIFLSKEDWQQAWGLAKGFLDTYASLNAWAQEEQRPLFHIVHKFHSFQHMVYQSRFLSVRAFWCWSNEDFVGKIATLGASLLHGNRSTRLSRKIGPKYQILLHLLITREGFQDVEKEF